MVNSSPTSDPATQQRVLVTGANGYIGTRLLQSLGEAGHQIIAVVRSRSRLHKDLVDSLGDQLEIIEADLTADERPELPRKIDAAYYLLHSMGSSADFPVLEKRCAEQFVKWVEPTECQRVVYLGALLPNDPELSKHLASRETVREILVASAVPVTTLRASIIVGSGSASFEIIRDLVEKLPVMITPKWVRTPCQPIAVRNVIHYLTECIQHPECAGQDYDIGGPSVLNYGEMLRGYAKVRGLTRLILPVPIFSPKLSAHWLNLMTATNYQLAKSLVGSLHMKTVCRNNGITKIIPQHLLSYEEAIERALSRIAQNRVPSTWYDSLNSGNLTHRQLGNIHVPEHGVNSDARNTPLTTDKSNVIDSIWSLGGKNGWPSMNWAWQLRGLIDKCFGGIGMRRGRRHPSKLRPGDALDFWRVILADRDSGRLILYAEMKLPGDAWLEYEIKDNVLYQTATFRPKGLLGRLYWLTTSPLHVILFPAMAKKLAAGWKPRHASTIHTIQP